MCSGLSFINQEKATNGVLAQGTSLAGAATQAAFPGSKLRLRRHRGLRVSKFDFALRTIAATRKTPMLSFMILMNHPLSLQYSISVFSHGIALERASVNISGGSLLQIAFAARSSYLHLCGGLCV